MPAGLPDLLVSPILKLYDKGSSPGSCALVTMSLALLGIFL